MPVSTVTAQTAAILGATDNHLVELAAQVLSNAVADPTGTCTLNYYEWPFLPPLQNGMMWVPSAAYFDFPYLGQFSPATDPVAYKDRIAMAATHVLWRILGTCKTNIDEIAGSIDGCLPTLRFGPSMRRVSQHIAKFKVQGRAHIDLPISWLAGADCCGHPYPYLSRNLKVFRDCSTKGLPELWCLYYLMYVWSLYRPDYYNEKHPCLNDIYGCLDPNEPPGFVPLATQVFCSNCPPGIVAPDEPIIVASSWPECPEFTWPAQGHHRTHIDSFSGWARYAGTHVQVLQSGKRARLSSPHPGCIPAVRERCCAEIYRMNAQDTVPAYYQGAPCPEMWNALEAEDAPNCQWGSMQDAPCGPADGPNAWEPAVDPQPPMPCACNELADPNQ